jgi:hypothetical protein
MTGGAWDFGVAAAQQDVTRSAGTTDAEIDHESDQDGN